MASRSGRWSCIRIQAQQRSLRWCERNVGQLVLAAEKWKSGGQDIEEQEDPEE